MNRRQPTKSELELEAMPLCFYDPLGILACGHYKNPTKKVCKECLTQFISDALEDGSLSEVMRWFIAYKNLEQNK